MLDTALASIAQFAATTWTTIYDAVAGTNWTAAAIVAALSLGWNILRHWRDKPRLSFRVTPKTTILGDPKDPHITHKLVFHAVNLGHRDMQLERFGALNRRRLPLGRRDPEGEARRLDGAMIVLPITAQPEDPVKFEMQLVHHRPKTSKRYYMEDGLGRRWYVPRRDMWAVWRIVWRAKREEYAKQARRLAQKDEAERRRIEKRTAAAG